MLFDGPKLSGNTLIFAFSIFLGATSPKVSKPPVKGPPPPSFLLQDKFFLTSQISFFPCGFSWRSAEKLIAAGSGFFPLLVELDNP